MTTPGATQPVPPLASPTREAAHSTANTAKGEAHAVADTARIETARLASEARAELRKQGDEQTRRVADRVRDVGEQLEGVQRGEVPQGPVANVLADVGSRASRLAERLDSGGIDTVARDVKQFARQRPGLFLLGAFGLGIVAGRTLRNADTHALVEAAKPSNGDTTSAYDEAAPSGSASESYAQPGDRYAAAGELYPR